MTALPTQPPSICRLKFDGKILERGFWLYVWRVTSRKRIVLYVGRTGDISSNFASSPFVRIGRHLDLRSKATSNTLARRLKEESIELAECSFEFVSFGPLFPEQSSKDGHVCFRDRIGALEAFLAKQLRERGYEVLGVHPTSHKPQQHDLDSIKGFMDAEFP